jgi:hypothetical protein
MGYLIGENVKKFCQLVTFAQNKMISRDENELLMVLFPHS